MFFLTFMISRGLHPHASTCYSFQSPLQVEHCNVINISGLIFPSYSGPLFLSLLLDFHIIKTDYFCIEMNKHSIGLSNAIQTARLLSNIVTVADSIAVF